MAEEDASSLYSLTQLDGKTHSCVKSTTEDPPGTMDYVKPSTLHSKTKSINSKAWQDIFSALREVFDY